MKKINTSKIILFILLCNNYQLFADPFIPPFIRNHLGIMGPNPAYPKFGSVPTPKPPPYIEVHKNMIFSTQAQVGSDVIAAKLAQLQAYTGNGLPFDYPLVIQEGEKFFVQDGHHGIQVQIDNGQELIKVRPSRPPGGSMHEVIEKGLFMEAKGMKLERIPGAKNIQHNPMTYWNSQRSFMNRTRSQISTLFAHCSTARNTAARNTLSVGRAGLGLGAQTMLLDPEFGGTMGGELGASIGEALGFDNQTSGNIGSLMGGGAALAGLGVYQSGLVGSGLGFGGSMEVLAAGGVETGTTLLAAAPLAAAGGAAAGGLAFAGYGVYNFNNAGADGTYAGFEFDPLHPIDTTIHNVGAYGEAFSDIYGGLKFW